MSKVDYCATKFACIGLDEALRVEMLVQVVNIVDLLKSAKPSALKIETGNISCCKHTNQSESILNRCAG